MAEIIVCFQDNCNSELPTTKARKIGGRWFCRSCSRRIIRTMQDKAEETAKKSNLQTNLSWEDLRYPA